MRCAIRIEPVRFDHEDTGADQQIAETGARADATVAVVRRVRTREELRVFPFTGEEHLVPRHEHVVEDRDPGGLAVLCAELRRVLARPAGGSRHDRQIPRVDRHGAAYGEIRIALRHIATGHDEQFVHVRCARDDRLRAADYDAVRATLLDMHVGIRVRLVARTQGAIALTVRHRHPEGQIIGVHLIEIGEEARMVFAVRRLIDAVRRLVDRVQRIVREIALRAAAFAAYEAGGFEFVQQIVGRLIDSQHTIHGCAVAPVFGRHQVTVALIEREIVVHPDGVDSRREPRVVGDAGNPFTVDEYTR